MQLYVPVGVCVCLCVSEYLCLNVLMCFVSVCPCLHMCLRICIVSLCVRACVDWKVLEPTLECRILASLIPLKGIEQ